MRRLLLRPLAILVLMAASGCVHSQLTSADLVKIRRPAFVSRIVQNAGPRCEIFESDAALAGTLRHLEPAEADRRLQFKLGRSITRFQISDGLRASVLALLPAQAPWSQTLPPVSVATVLQSFLVEDVPANAPDYALLRRLKADAVVELVVQDYGLRSSLGKPRAFIRGYARLFLLGGPELWRRSFERDLGSKGPVLDPFALAREPTLFREAMEGMLESVAGELAQGLKTPGSAPPLPPASEEFPAPSLSEPDHEALPEDVL